MGSTQFDIATKTSPVLPFRYIKTPYPPFGHTKDTLQTPFRYPSEALKTPSRHPQNTLQTPSTLHTHTRQPQDSHQISNKFSLTHENKVNSYSVQLKLSNGSQVEWSLTINEQPLTTLHSTVLI